MMTFERPKNALDNFGKSIHQFQPETKTFIWELERILIKIYRQTYIYIYIVYNKSEYTPHISADI